MIYDKETPRPLRLEFTKHKVGYKQLMRKGGIALYECDHGEHKSYEVLKKIGKTQMMNIEVVNDKIIRTPTGEYKEIYPNNEDFGTKAFCFNNHKEAFDLFDKLTFEAQK